MSKCPTKITFNKRFWEFMCEVAKELRDTYGLCSNEDVIYDLGPLIFIDNTAYVTEKYLPEFKRIIERKKGQAYLELFERTVLAK